MIVGVPFEGIQRTLRTSLKVTVSPAALELFAATFFDATSMTRAELRIDVARRVRISVKRRVADPDDEVAAQRAIAADARVVAASLPSQSPFAWSAALMSAGIPPIRRDLGAILPELETVAAVRAGEALLRGDVGDERRAAGFIDVVETLRRIRETVSNPQSDLMKQMAAFRIAHGKPALTVSQLLKPGDQITVDLGPPLKLPYDPEDEEDTSKEDDEEMPLP